MRDLSTTLVPASFLPERPSPARIGIAVLNIFDASIYLLGVVHSRIESKDLRYASGVPAIDLDRVEGARIPRRLFAPELRKASPLTFVRPLSRDYLESVGLWRHSHKALFVAHIRSFGLSVGNNYKSNRKNGC